MEERNNSKYCYENGVLKNLYSITDQDLLHKIERNITTYKIAQLECGKVLFDDFFDVNNYLKLHHYIFSDIYSFAGEIRDEAIYKSNEPYRKGVTPFCYPSFIYQNLDSLLKEMSRNVRNITSYERLVHYISYYYSEINVVHPFREGNGRTLRIFLKLLLDAINKDLPFEDMEICYGLWNSYDRERLLEGTILSNTTGNISMIEECYLKIIVPKERGKVK